MTLDPPSPLLPPPRSPDALSTTGEARTRPKTSRPFGNRVQNRCPLSLKTYPTSKINSPRAHSLPQWRSQHALQHEPSPGFPTAEGANMPRKHCPCLPGVVLGLWQGCLVPLLTQSPIPLLVTFCASTCLPAESDFSLGRWRAAQPQAAHSHQNGQATGQADHPSSSTACPPSLQRDRPGRRREKRVLSEVNLCC